VSIFKIPIFFKEKNYKYLDVGQNLTEFEKKKKKKKKKLIPESLIFYFLFFVKKKLKN
jgi:hypothetical protein